MSHRIYFCNFPMMQIYTCCVTQQSWRTRMFWISSFILHIWSKMLPKKSPNLPAENDFFLKMMTSQQVKLSKPKKEVLEILWDGYRTYNLLAILQQSVTFGDFHVCNLSLSNHTSRLSLQPNPKFVDLWPWKRLPSWIKKKKSTLGTCSKIKLLPGFWFITP